MSIVRARRKRYVSRAKPPEKPKQPQRAKKKNKGGKKRNGPAPPVRWESYAEYLLSPWWKWRRKQAKKRASFRCRRCGSSGPLEVHHRNYKRLGKEKDSDLEVLCSPCHEHHHFAGLREMEQHLDAIARQL